MIELFLEAKAEHHYIGDKDDDAEAHWMQHWSSNDLSDSGLRKNFGQWGLDLFTQGIQTLSL